MKLTTPMIALAAVALSACYGRAHSETLPAPPPDFRKSYTRAPVAEFAASTSNTPIPPDASIYFEVDSDRLTPEDRAELDAAADWLERNPDEYLAVAGHADRAGTTAYNLTLSIRRTRAVREYLLSVGADHARIVSYAYGEYKAQPTRSSSRRVLVYATSDDGPRIDRPRVSLRSAR